jgi:prolyl 4-hydroxylase
MSSKTSHSHSLREWVLSTAQAGHDIDQIIQMMLRAGYQPRQARQLVAKILDRPAVAMSVATDKRNGRRSHHPEPPFQVVDGKRVDVSVCVDRPPIRVLEGFMDQDECEQLIELARPRLDRSLTVDKTGDDQVDRARTSQGMFFQVGETPLIEHIEQRIALLVDMPVHYGEGLQILRYAPGQQYEPHYDWFNPDHQGYPMLTARSGQRVASVVIYLNSPAGGGGTQFPRAGVTVTARRGSAVYFAYEEGDKDSLHAGLPVTEGEKWIATKWLRELPFS